MILQVNLNLKDFTNTNFKNKSGMSVHQQIIDALKTFESISLKEMDSVELMNRTDTKYIYNLKLLPEIIVSSRNHYRVLEINGEIVFTYKTTYYDTPNYTLFNNHISGKLNRHKIRHRIYESTGVSYLEVKFKSNKNRTIKWRIKNEILESFDKKAIDFLTDRTHMDLNSLNAVVTNYFKRITLVSIEDKTRITLDFDLIFKGGHGSEKELPYLAIAEIKQDGYNNTNTFIKILKKMGIRQAGFSKYCIGNALLNDIPRKNILKPNFLHLKRIQNEYDTINTFGN